ncbi:hypothetical protein Cantr_09921 [Candida viswanathii]|uniref:Uncharacterized protein n=1 Tax=Candida viswanathii TaxID=5486 RepID=A0A367YBF0_9ASCO|nr:hypothetical protein Cantr_09894 [Candida viswanathii]RCK63126.1 hypothetical protein Cantr_09921 [Candida viswanathii]
MYAQHQNFHNCNTNFNDNLYFNPHTPQEICPRVWLGPYDALLSNPEDPVNFLVDHNIKIIINCGTTLPFLDLLENNRNITISSDVLVMSLDPMFSSNHELVGTFVRKYTRVLTNYLNFFYKTNPEAGKLIHQLPGTSECIQLTSPILCGSNLTLQFFNLIRLINLFKLINQELEIYIVSHDGNDNLLTGLMIAYLMDTYRYNLVNSLRMIRSRRPSIHELSCAEYEDLLAQFYVQNCEIKCTPLIMTQLKRASQEDDTSEVIAGGGDRKRRFLH